VFYTALIPKGVILLFSLRFL